MAQGIAAIGECMLELSGQSGNAWRMGYAGDTFNTLWTLRALSAGHHVDYVSAFGDDPFSEGQIEFFREHGIGIAKSPVIAATHPGLYAIMLKGAERSFTYWRGDAAARQLTSDPAGLAKSLENRLLIYFSGITLAILSTDARQILLKAIAAERARGCHIAFDPNYRARLWPNAETARSAIAAALAITDIALPTFPDEEELYGDTSPEATAKRLERAGVAEIIVKNGDQPALISHYQKTETVAATPIDAPLDTTGAGDAFNGAYLAARLLGIAPAEAAKRAHRVAGAVVQVPGALAPFDLLRMAFDR
jgi:2-dehydro-3-deoxygluconokinase